MSHSSTQNPDLSASEMRKFGLITGLIIVVLFGFLLPWIFKSEWAGPWPFTGELTKPTWPWIIAFALWIPALVYPVSLRPVYKWWMKFGEAIGFVNSRIILGFVFYAIFMPAGFIMRLLGNDPMRRKLDADSTTYRVESKVPSSANSMERPF